MGSMIKNIVFDMGNVLIGFNAEYVASQFTSDPDARAQLLQVIFYAPEWAMTDAGLLSDEEFLTLIEQRLPPELAQAGRDAYLQWQRYNRPIPKAEALVRELKAAGYQLYLLSNASVRWETYWRDFPAMTMLDGHVVSAFVKAVKPGEGIFRVLFDRYGIKPEESFFVDDLPANIAGAQAMGMDGFLLDHFQYDALRDALRARGVKI